MQQPSSSDGNSNGPVCVFDAIQPRQVSYGLHARVPALAQIVRPMDDLALRKYLAASKPVLPITHFRRSPVPRGYTQRAELRTVAISYRSAWEGLDSRTVAGRLRGAVPLLLWATCIPG
ncbi:hypothetical protein CSOJ01_01124 [Colletotrichum sojae]|uniref:Uncharacterized protein n=1 Tax=Colletotrichum sojae TaxID=2175907 RepID=A0A8H6JUP2_9PEZI|nr:hypothetical protein CSOJ01_01124 [Colletotrichum sojae]